MVNKIETNMKEVLYYSELIQSKLTIKSGADAGKQIIQRNLECMKKWSEDDFARIFDEEGNLKWPSRETVRGISIICRTRNYLSANNRACAKYDLVKNTRHFTMPILKLVFEHKNLREFEMPSELELKRMARDLISVENIRNNFKMRIIYDPEKYY